MISITDYRREWTVHGQYVAALPAETQVEPQHMIYYYGLAPADERYDGLAAPSKYPRLVLLKPNGSFVVVPINPHVVISESA